MTAANMTSTPSLVVDVDQNGVFITPPAVAADGSTKLTGANGTGEASGTNPVWTRTGYLQAGTDRSGTATTTSALLAAQNTTRRGLTVQNISGVNIGINEFGGTAAIGTAGTYTLLPNATLSVSTRNQINVICASGTAAFTASEF